MVATHAERPHALLSASAAHRWLACPPSARLCEQFPDTTSEYAAEGTLAHELAELKLRKALKLGNLNAREFNKRRKEIESHPLYSAEMDTYTDQYVDYVLGIVHDYRIPPYVTVEKRIDYSVYAPEGFGTGDCIVIGGETLHIIDLKYGKGVRVSGEGNPQMRLYALGALQEYGFLYPIAQIHTAIVQPRLDSISEETISVDDLLAWGASIKPIAEMAYRGEGEFKAGEHCRFCRAKSVCRARAEQYLALEEFGQAKPPLITDSEVGEILRRAKALAEWVADLEEYALQQCLAGNEIPGWKAVEGRGSRQYVDLDAAFKALIDAGVDEAVLYERKPLSVAQLEKVLGKAQYRQLLEEPGLVRKEPGKPTLVPESDKRPAITAKITAQEAFGGDQE